LGGRIRKGWFDSSAFSVGDEHAYLRWAKAVGGVHCFYALAIAPVFGDEDHTTDVGLDTVLTRYGIWSGSGYKLLGLRAARWFLRLRFAM